jgi:hypothetical protein
MTQAIKKRVPEQFDLFLPYLADMPLRDQREMMERPFFSLAKRKRTKPIEYTAPDGKLWVHVSANPDYGMATIWDADILIYCPESSTSCPTIYSVQSEGPRLAAPTSFSDRRLIASSRQQSRPTFAPRTAERQPLAGSMAGPNSWTKRPSEAVA